MECSTSITKYYRNVTMSLVSILWTNTDSSIEPLTVDWPSQSVIKSNSGITLAVFSVHWPQYTVATVLHLHQESSCFQLLFTLPKWSVQILNSVISRTSAYITSRPHCDDVCECLISAFFTLLSIISHFNKCNHQLRLLDWSEHNRTCQSKRLL